MSAHEIKLRPTHSELRLRRIAKRLRSFRRSLRAPQGWWLRRLRILREGEPPVVEELVPQYRRTVTAARIESATGHVEPQEYRFEPNPEYTRAEEKSVLGNILARILSKMKRQGGPSSAPDLLAQVADSALSKRDLCDLIARVKNRDARAAAEVVRRFGRENPPEEAVHLAWLRRGAPALRRDYSLTDAEAVRGAREGDEARAAGHAREIEQIELQREARRVVGAAIAQKEHERATASPTERRAARKWLRHVLQDPKRGRPWGWPGTPTEIVVRYWRERFRWVQVEALLQWDGQLTRQKAAVRVLYGLRPLARGLGWRVNDLLGLVASPAVGGCRAHKMALYVTLRAHGKNDPRQLANLLARYGVKWASASRKA
jgi:hypothetical protein